MTQTYYVVVNALGQYLDGEDKFTEAFDEAFLYRYSEVAKRDAIFS